jgi:hypothetical protein
MTLNRNNTHNISYFVANFKYCSDKTKRKDSKK